MKIFEAIPHTSLGPVGIGVERSEVHRVMGVPESSFKKATTSVHPTDAWFRGAFQVFYTAAGKVEFIEVTGGAGVEVICFGVPVFSTTVGSLTEKLGKELAFSSEDSGCSFISRGTDIALWRPNPEAPEESYFSTFGLGDAGYYA
ncbi:hypothetical protein [Solimonas fluminis]|uniref:hypothetical protein n=1 Tax=Solimonas fluminis TaxID=2086571 RepID=UPI00105712C2|nr:hypothetical protein [Solimonas fluminis]